MNTTQEALYNLVNAYLNSHGFSLTRDEFHNLLACAKYSSTHASNPRVAAIKYLRDCTQITEEELFKLDLSDNFDNIPSSPFTRWVIETNADLTNGKTKTKTLGLYEAKHVVEFIQLNL
jgi:hypothetical protein